MGAPNKPCSECPFLVHNAGEMDAILVDQMGANADFLGGFPCHTINPGNCILTCASPATNANDCVGYRMMRENLTEPLNIHPEVVGCFDELMR